MTIPPRGDRDEPAPIRDTGVGWPDSPPLPSASPPVPEPPPADSSFADAVQRYRAGTSSTARPGSPYPVPVPRPGTVTAAAVILFIGAGFGVLACCGINLLAAEADLGDGEQTTLLIISAVIALTSLLNAVLGYFVLAGRRWARVTTIVICALGAAGAVVGLFLSAGGRDTGGDGFGGTCLGLILNIVIIALLSGERAGDYFRQPAG